MRYQYEFGVRLHHGVHVLDRKIMFFLKTCLVLYSTTAKKTFGNQEISGDVSVLIVVNHSPTATVLRFLIRYCIRI